MPDSPPQTQPEAQPRKSHARFWAGVATGSILGAVAALGGAFVLLTTATGEGLLQEYYFASNSAKIQNIPVVLPPVSSVPPLNVLVPKQYAGQAYYNAINGVLNTFNSLATTTTALNAVLKKIQDQAVSGNYTGLFDLVFQAKTLIAQGESLDTQFGVALASLETANQQTVDAQTNSLTTNLIGSGQDLQSSFTKLYAAIDSLLSGAPPTNAQIQLVITQSQVLQGQSQTFETDAGTVMQYFAAYK